MTYPKRWPLKIFNRKLYFNRLHNINALIYIIIVYCFAMLAAYYSYEQEKSSLLQINHEAVTAVEYYFSEKCNDFWTIYSPAYRDDDYMEAVSEFLTSESEEPDALLRSKLVNLFSLITIQDEDIRWILLYKAGEDHGYIFNPDTYSLTRSGSDFPGIATLKNKTAVRNLLGTSDITIGNTSIKTYAISGNTGTNSPGSLMVGYDLQPLQSIYNRYNFQLPPHILLTTLDGAVIYDSEGEAYGSKYAKFLSVTQNGKISDRDGRDYYIETVVKPTRKYQILCITDWRALFKGAHKNTGNILGFATLFAVLSTFLYLYAGHRISRRVTVISEGLEQIGQHNLSYRIPLADSPDEFGEISRNINNMSAAIENNIQQLYVYQLRQKTAELGELQSKFDPHFLYNTLEIIRANIQKGGDNESSEMIMLLSRIFRNSIGGRPFVTIHEEITACSMYLQLFRLRYGDRVRVVTDISTGVLEYGIIRNLLQPVIENYFVHGIGPERTDNRIVISAVETVDGITFSVEDNGLGIPEARMNLLLRELNGDDINKTSYGLRNVNDRIHIFYGPDYGIDVQSNPASGTIVRVRISKMSCQEHEARMRTENT